MPRNGRFYFLRDGGSGRDLWYVDHPGPGGSSILWGAALDERLVFSASEPVSGCGVWTSDGTTKGTVRLHDLATGPASSHPRGFSRIEESI